MILARNGYINFNLNSENAERCSSVKKRLTMAAPNRSVARASAARWSGFVTGSCGAVAQHHSAVYGATIRHGIGPRRDKMCRHEGNKHLEKCTGPLAQQPRGGAARVECSTAAPRASCDHVKRIVHCCSATSCAGVAARRSARASTRTARSRELVTSSRWPPARRAQLSINMSVLYALGRAAGSV